MLELGAGVATAYAAKLMGDLGASVIKVEPPAGDRARTRGPFPGGTPHRERSGLFLFLNTNKQSVTLDLASERAELARLIAWADIVVDDHRVARQLELGISFAQLSEARPDLVLCSITPFGQSGPYSEYRAEELTVAHGGGWAFLSPGALEDPERPPLKAFGHQSDYQGGLAGALASLAAHYRARRTGLGEHIDLSVQEYIASFLEQAIPYHTYAGLLATRHGQRGLQPWGIFRCRDGLIFLATIEQDQWERLVEFMGRPEWAELEVFAQNPGRFENLDLLHGFLQEWIGEWSVDELFHAGQKRRICFAPVLSMEQLGRQEHLRERGFLVSVDHPETGALTYPGPAYRLREPWWQVRSPAPRLGEHTDEIRRAELPARVAAAREGADDAGLPLAGVRVADFSWVWAGPFCGMMLAHLGACVIKLESTGRPDLGRRLPIFVPDTEPGLNRSGYFNQWNQGKKSVSLDLSQPDALAVAKRIVASCDVVVENFATGVMDRLGLGYDALRAVRPDLIYASISGYGDAGPWRDYMAYGPAIGPLAGLSALSGYQGGEPRELGISLGDPTAGLTAAVAICAALVARGQGGAGQYIDVSLWESVAALVAEGFLEQQMNGRPPERMGNRDPWMAPHGCFRCAGDDDWVTIACADDGEWRRLCGVVDPPLAEDPRFGTATLRKQNEDALDGRIGAWTRGLDRFEVTRRLQAVGVAAFPSLSPADLVADPHLGSRGFIARLDHPEVGPRAHTGIPWRLARGPNGVRSPAPQLGAHTDEVLREIGYSAEEIRRLSEAKVLY